MRISGRIMAFVVPGVVIGGILLGAATGWWETESSKVPVTFTEGEFAGEANPADIRGSYSLADVAAAFDVPVDVLAEAFLLTGESAPGDVLIKEFEERYGILPAADEAAAGDYEIGTDAMRLFVARYRSLPYEPEEDTGVFAAGLELVRTAGRAAPEMVEELASRVVVAPGTPDSPTDGAESAAVAMEEAAPEEASPADPSDEEYLVKGNTTFGQVLTWGVPETEIRALLGGEIGARGEQIRTWCMDQEISFSTVKTGLQALVDRAVQ